MSKKPRKRIIIKRLGAVLLAIILGASPVPAALAGEITESEYSAPEQNTAAAATEKENSNGTATSEKALESREAGTEEAADTFQTDSEKYSQTPADAATLAAATEEAADASVTGAVEDSQTPADAATLAAVAEEAADAFEKQEQGTTTDGQNSESVSTLPAYAGEDYAAEDYGRDGQTNDMPAEAVDPSAPPTGDSDSGTTAANDTSAETVGPLAPLTDGSETTSVGKKSYHLPVFQTSDTHGMLAYTSTGTTQYRLAYISDKVRDVRGRGDGYDKSLAVLLDGGDIYQGNIISSLVKGESLSAVYDAMDYDAVTIGNHDFDWYIETTVDPDGTMTDYTLDGQTCVNDVPVVISNLRKNGENVDFADDYIILEKTATDQNGEQISVRVAVIGFAENYATSIMKDKFTDEGYSIQEDYDLANQLAAQLEESGKCDATILLCHLAADKAAGRLGENTAVDLVLGGHTHINMCGVNDWGLTYMQPADSGKAYAYAELVFETDEQGAPLLTAVESTRTVDVTEDVEKLKKDPANEQELDERIVELTDIFLEKIQEILNEKIGYITTSATNTALPESGGRSSTMGNWMASMFTRALDADVCFINGGAIRTSFVVDEETPEKDIYLADIYTVNPLGGGRCDSKGSSPISSS